MASYLLVHGRLFMCALKMRALKTPVYWLRVMAIVRFVFISIYFFQSLMSKLFVIRACILHAQSLQETNLQVLEHMSKERGRRLFLNFKNAGSVRCTRQDLSHQHIAILPSDPLNVCYMLSHSTLLAWANSIVCILFISMHYLTLFLWIM